MTTDTSQSTAPARRKARIDYNGSTDPQEILALNRVVASPFQVTKHKKDAARQWDVFYKVRSALLVLPRGCTIPQELTQS